MGQEQKWENPLMGWTSSGDPLAHQISTTIKFGSKEAAMAFCNKHGWEFEVLEPQKMAWGAA
jgi:NADH dehydrogenase (ubiquinone) Fe-S protein 4